MSPRARVPARRTLLAAVLAGAVAVASACVPPPASGPRLATGGDAAPASADPGAAAGPSWTAPGADLPWAPCPYLHVPGTSCVDLRTEVSDAAGPLLVPVVRVVSDRTPADAAPLVLTPGAEVDRDDLVARIRTGWSDVLDRHPVVVLTHRATVGAADSCAPMARAVVTLAERDVDPAAGRERANLTRATQACLDRVEGGELSRGAEGVAADLETLRTAWGVPALGVLSIGAGSAGALRYAADRPDRTAFLALDSPTPTGAAQAQATEEAAAGSTAALAQWAAQCSRPECGSADGDRARRVAESVGAAREPGATVPAALLVELIRRALADLSGSSQDRASAGDRLLGDLAATGGSAPSEAVRRSAEALRSHSGALVAECTDTAERVPAAGVAELSARLAAGSPAFGPVLAAWTARCSAWPTPRAEPTALRPDLPVLVLASAADPAAGDDPVSRRAGELTGMGTRVVHTVAWQAPGSGVVDHSACGREALRAFVDDPAGVGSTGCPS